MENNNMEENKIKNNDVIRITGSESFVKKAGDTIVSLMVGNYNVNDGGTKQSRNPKYKNNYIRYIKVEEREEGK